MISYQISLVYYRPLMQLAIACAEVTGNLVVTAIPLKEAL